MHALSFEWTEYFTLWLLKESGKKNLRLKVCACFNKKGSLRCKSDRL